MNKRKKKKQNKKMIQKYKPFVATTKNESGINITYNRIRDVVFITGKLPENHELALKLPHRLVD